MAEDEEVYAWPRLMQEAGVNPRLIRFHQTLWPVLFLLLAIAVVLIVVGVFVAIFVNPILLVLAIVMLGGVVVSMVVATLHRNQLIESVRWQQGTVTFHTVEPGETGENGQYVACQVTTQPPTGIHRVYTMAGAMDARYLVAGATMRCLIDRNDGFSHVLRVYPQATPDTPYPTGYELKFNKA